MAGMEQTAGMFAAGGTGHGMAVGPIVRSPVRLARPDIPMNVQGAWR